ncbi:MAG: tRNA epoxyqueuosine(34) reductase QueG [Thermoplasmatales archaeon]
MITRLGPAGRGTAVSSVRVGLSDISKLEHWIALELNAEMSYISRMDRLMKIQDTSLLMRGAKSILIFLVKYGRGKEPPTGYGKIASYALYSDYHDTIKDQITKFVTENGLYVDMFRVYVDTGPVEERGIGSQAGLGWIGRNSMLINRELGSFTFIGTAVTDVVIDSQTFPQADLCGRCTRCIDSCPTHAIRSDRTVDSNLCISYHTIENRGVIPKGVAAKMDNMIFGCDICNDVCPWNFSKEGVRSDWIEDRDFLTAMKLEDLAYVDKESFNDKFKSAALKRAGDAGLARNATVALFNSGREDIVRDVAMNFDDVRGSQARALLGSK